MVGSGTSTGSAQPLAGLALQTLKIVEPIELEFGFFSRNSAFSLATKIALGCVRKSRDTRLQICISCRAPRRLFGVKIMDTRGSLCTPSGQAGLYENA